MSDSFSSPNVSYLQGSATAALTWVMYDVFLTFEREVVSVWRSSWSLSKILFLFSRYHTLIALGFFLMEATRSWDGTFHTTTEYSEPPQCTSRMYRPSKRSSMTDDPSSLASRWYLGLTEVFSILVGEFLILIRINAVYGWSRKIVVLTLFLFCAEAVIGLVTTIFSIRGGSKGLLGSTGILTCMPNQANVPDVNISRRCTSMTVACIYIGLIIQKATDVIQVIDAADGQPKKMSFLAAFRAAKMTPTLYLCLRDAVLYFVVIFGVLLLNLVLILQHNRYAQLGTPWLLATYSVASTRIFLNLKDMTLTRHLYSGGTWSEFQQSSAMEFQMQSALRASQEVQSAWPTSHEVRSVSHGGLGLGRDAEQASQEVQSAWRTSHEDSIYKDDGELFLRATDLAVSAKAPRTNQRRIHMTSDT
ncbi:hypothetical protein C8R44DRAFT_862625 [Mycena epipterygia]|nr:hypothetical protein C8R44DRAFT_862625 [Mycena epipterygia]